MVMQQFGSLFPTTDRPNTLDIMQLQYNIDNSRYQSIIHQIRFARIMMLSCLPWSCCWSGSITSSGTSSFTSTSLSGASVPNTLTEDEQKVCDALQCYEMRMMRTCNGLITQVTQLAQAKRSRSSTETRTIALE